MLDRNGMQYSPVALFVYARPEHTRLTLEALSRNKGAEQTILTVFSDGPRDDPSSSQVKEVRKIVEKARGFKRVDLVPRSSNIGLAESVISGVTAMLSQSSSVVVLEDDLTTSPAFLTYMNRALGVYLEEPRVYSVGAYQFPRTLLRFPREFQRPIVFSPRASSWGWATWADRWKNAKWEHSYWQKALTETDLIHRLKGAGLDLPDMLQAQLRGEVQSWAIRWAATHLLCGAVCATPLKSYINNHGMDGSGVHCGIDPRFYHPELAKDADFNFPSFTQEEESLLFTLRHVFRPSILERVRRKLERLGGQGPQLLK